MRQIHLSPLPLICVAASEDREWLGRWERHLHPLEQAGLISVWSELHLTAGTPREQAFRDYLEDADFIVLLLSSDFFSSSECVGMMEHALERAQAGTIRIIPLLLRSVVWQESPLGRLAPWPSNGKPITLWSDQDEGWDACVLDLRRLLGRQVALAHASEPSQKHTDPDWEHMLRRLKRSYSDLLDQSLRGLAWMELSISDQPDMVSNVTNLLFQLPQDGERLLPPGTKILDAFDEAEGELLILGAPGAGKSTLLFGLARQLVDQALADEIRLLPVIFRLSSWAIRRPILADWMVEQLAHTYDVPRHLAERWVKEGRLLPLLDGLDEVEETARLACIAAINDYHRTHLAPLVVCSRQAEYKVATERERLALQNAVIVQPLCNKQIEDYLSAVGPSFLGVRVALQQEHALWKLATTPLMLSVLLQTYRDVSADDIAQWETDLEWQVWTDYVARQVREKGSDTRYPLKQTRSWLSFLAQQMRANNQPVFYLEHLQPDWLTCTQQRRYTWLAVRLPALLVGILASFLITPVSTSLEPKLFFQYGALGAWLGWVFSRRSPSTRGSPPNQAGGHYRLHRLGRHLPISILSGLILGLSFGLDSGGPHDWLHDGLFFGVVAGFGAFLLSWLLPSGASQNTAPAHIITKGQRWKRLVYLISTVHWQRALLVIVVVGGLTAMSHDLSIGLSIGLSNGLLCGLISILASLTLEAQAEDITLIERLQWSWKRLMKSLLVPKHVRTTFLIASVIALTTGLSTELGSKPSAALSIGLSYGLSYGLLYWLLLGLFQGVESSRIENSARLLPNQGVQRSLRNSILMALISSGIVGMVGMLSYGLLVGPLVGPHVILLVVSLLAVCGGLLVFASRGGLAVLRHYAIRLQLARSHTFPWHTQQFLEEAASRSLLWRVGGGYSFPHPLLHDYFADLPQEIP
jgi:TIR domain/NACHT domain